MQPSAGHAAIAVVRLHFEEWLERCHGVLTFRLTQVPTGHGCFGRYLFLIQQDDTSGCRQCVNHPEDTEEHTVEVYPAWVEHRRVLLEVIGGGNLSRPTLVETKVRGGAEAWQAGTFFCKAVMLAKGKAGRELETLQSSVSRSRRRPSGRLRQRRDDLRLP